MKPEEALKILKEKLDVLWGMMHGFDHSAFETKPLELLAPAANHIRSRKREEALSGRDGIGDEGVFALRHTG